MSALHPRRVDACAINTLQVVFKLVERCNINCSYCYYFNMGDATAFDRPARVSIETARAIADHIAQGCSDLQIPNVNIAFHGGEPMLLNSETFDAICDVLRERISPLAKLSFGIQTNGTVISDRWLELLRKHSVHVGVSIDGNRKAHDRFRLDHAGRSTFERIEYNIKRLVQWSGGDAQIGPSTISVLDWRNDYGEVYRYLRSLGILGMSFLLPDRNRDDGFGPDQGTSRLYGSAMADVFEAWLEDDDLDVSVRLINETLQHFQMIDQISDPVLPLTTGAAIPVPCQIIIVQSDGTLAVNDSYIPALSWYVNTPKPSVRDVSLREFLDSDVFYELDKMQSRAPTACQSCEWVGLCGGGDIENRFSAASGFDNPSVYCDGYKVFYSRVREGLIRGGYPLETFEERLNASRPVGSRLTPPQGSTTPIM
jgi:uncharacterized protein